MGANISQVAAEAGVSPTTVSHALSGKRSVSAETKVRIHEAVDRLGYRPNLLAKGFRSQRTHTVGLLVADISNPYYPELARSVGDVLAVDGYIAFILNTDGSADRERTYLHEVVARSVDGVIVQAMSLGPEEIRHIVGDETPLVVLGDGRGEHLFDQVSTDDALGIHEAVDHLRSTGRTDLAFLNGAGSARLAAFEVASKRSGLEIGANRTASTEFTRAGGVSAMTWMLEVGPPPQAVLCANDLIAIGAMDVIHARGLRIPDDIAVVGFDNIETADLVTPRLTTVDNFAAAVGSAAAHALLGRMLGGTSPYESLALPTRLVVRESA
nr:LacI family DNA-binding transcriptional regulator [Frigoribacterium sp. PhB24]